MKIRKTILGIIMIAISFTIGFLIGGSAHEKENLCFPKSHIRNMEMVDSIKRQSIIDIQWMELQNSKLKRRINE